jgi:ectoine hydroxylase-related dioxygenase (phytanoyl-CoA dioxygenase family)
MPSFHAYLETRLPRRGLSARPFHARKGDVFLWHPLLYHAGGKITNMEKTRKSLVAHYFAAADYPLGTWNPLNVPFMYEAGRYYENQVLPGAPAHGRQLSWPGR